MGASMAFEQLGIGSSIINTLFTAVTSSLVGIMIIKYGVGGIWAARDRFWPAVYNRVGSATADTSVRQG